MKGAPFSNKIRRSNGTGAGEDHAQEMLELERMTIGTSVPHRGGYLLVEIFIVVMVLLIVGIGGWFLWGMLP